MQKTKRKQIAEETLEILKCGHYRSPNGATVSIRELQQAAERETRLYDETTLSGGLLKGATHDMVVTVNSESTGEALARLASEGKQNVACLNFASAKNPGGGFLGGAQAQEECLARSSGLYPCLLTQCSYYERNRANRSPIYLDLLIHSPNVPFIRDDEGALYDEPVVASVITCPAPNRGAVLANQPQQKHEIVPALQRRTRMVLRAAAINGAQHLVLGAWGCGVFRNDPEQVADIFAEALQEYRGQFIQIVFAIYGGRSGPNLSAFQRAVSGN